MFESIVILNARTPGLLIDAGTLAEALLFYQRVLVVANTGTLKDLLRAVPPYTVLGLMRRGNLEVHYLEDQIGISSRETSPGRVVHGFVAFSSPQHTIEQVAPKIFRKFAGNTSQAKLGARRFTRLIKPIGHRQFNQQVVADNIADSSYAEAAAARILQGIAPAYNQHHPLRFSLNRETEGYIVDTNIDFVHLNAIYHRMVSEQHSSIDKIDKAYLLELMQKVHEELYFAGLLQSEVASDPVCTDIHQLRINSLVQKHLQSQSNISMFTDLVLGDACAIREAINDGRAQFPQLLHVLDQADKFRHWLADQSPDSDLVRAYYQETIKKTWIERLPSKITRWGVFTGAGLTLDALVTGGAGTAVGLGISAIDAFFLDRLLNAWKPHHFVEGELKRILFQQET